MEKEIILKIIGKHGYGEEEVDVVEFFSEGKISKDEEGISIEYEESELSGMPGCTTVVRSEKNIVSMSRNSEDGKIFSKLNFEESKTHSGMMSYGEGELLVEVTVEKIENTLEYDNLGSINVVYTINLPGLGKSKSSLEIDVIKNS